MGSCLRANARLLQRKALHPHPHRHLPLLAGALALALGVVGCGASTATTPHVSSSSFPTVAAPTGTSIPHVTVTFGMRPVANDVMFVSAMKQGFFKDVGITIAPSPYGNKSTFNNAVPLLLNNTLDIQAYDPIPAIAALGTVHTLRFISLAVIFLGYEILASPATHDKTVSQFMSTGLSFKQAMRKTLEQMKGQTLTLPPIISDRGFLDTSFAVAGLNMATTVHEEVVSDPTGLNLASSGKTDYATFDGAPYTAQLLGAGWIPLVTPLDLSKNMPPSVSSPSELLVEPPGLAATAQWASQNAATVMRFVSVQFRLVHEILSAPTTALSYELPFLNAFAGTHLTIAELDANILKLDPPIPFRQQSPYYNDPSSALYYKNWFEATLKFDIKSGLVPKGSYSANNLIWAGDVYKQLVKFQRMTSALLAKSAQEHLTTAQRTLLAQAKKYYGWYDFLDAYRYARAAVG